MNGTYSSEIIIEDFGQISFEEACLRREIARKALADDQTARILVCEHPPTLSLGLRTQASDLKWSDEEWRRRRVSVVKADRGGGPTIHSPGQLILYPVINLRAHRLGVKRYVVTCLEAIATALLSACRTKVMACETPAGVFVRVSSTLQKIASAGVRVRDGITDHGFSVNVSNDLSFFLGLRACGLDSTATSVEVLGVPGADVVAIKNLIVASVKNSLIKAMYEKTHLTSLEGLRYIESAENLGKRRGRLCFQNLV